MATYNAVTMIPVVVNVSSGTAAALINRFVTWDTSNEGRVITHVPGANGAAAVGILMEAVETDSDGEHESSMAIPNGAIVDVLLGENCTLGADLRVGGNSSETDGAAYLANATNDVIVAKALQAGSAGEIIRVQFLGYAGLAA